MTSPPKKRAGAPRKRPLDQWDRVYLHFWAIELLNPDKLAKSIHEELRSTIPNPPAAKSIASRIRETRQRWLKEIPLEQQWEALEDFFAQHTDFSPHWPKALQQLQRKAEYDFWHGNDHPKHAAKTFKLLTRTMKAKKVTRHRSD